MLYENDKLNIPEKFQKMSVSELKREKERIYKEMSKSSNERVKKSVDKEQTIKFYL